MAAQAGGQIGLTVVAALAFPEVAAAVLPAAATFVAVGEAGNVGLVAVESLAEGRSPTLQGLADSALEGGVVGLVLGGAVGVGASLVEGTLAKLGVSVLTGATLGGAVGATEAVLAGQNPVTGFEEGAALSAGFIVVQEAAPFLARSSAEVLDSLLYPTAGEGAYESPLSSGYTRLSVAASNFKTGVSLALFGPSYAEEAAPELALEVDEATLAQGVTDQPGTTPPASVALGKGLYVPSVEVYFDPDEGFDRLPTAADVSTYSAPLKEYELYELPENSPSVTSADQIKLQGAPSGVRLLGPGDVTPYPAPMIGEEVNGLPVEGEKLKLRSSSDISLGATPGQQAAESAALSLGAETLTPLDEEQVGTLDYVTPLAQTTPLGSKSSLSSTETTLAAKSPLDTGSSSSSSSSSTGTVASSSFHVAAISQSNSLASESSFQGESVIPQASSSIVQSEVQYPVGAMEQSLELGLASESALEQAIDLGQQQAQGTQLASLSEFESAQVPVLDTGLSLASQSAQALDLDLGLALAQPTESASSQGFAPSLRVDQDEVTSTVTRTTTLPFPLTEDLFTSDGSASIPLAFPDLGWDQHKHHKKLKTRTKVTETKFPVATFAPGFSFGQKGGSGYEKAVSRAFGAGVGFGSPRRRKGRRGRSGW